MHNLTLIKQLKEDFFPQPLNVFSDSFLLLLSIQIKYFFIWNIAWNIMSIGTKKEQKCADIRE